MCHRPSIVPYLFATQRLHQEHEEPYPHRSEDREEDDGEPERCLGDETGQFVHKPFVSQ